MTPPKRLRPSRDSARYRFQARLVGLLGAALLRLLGASWRLRFAGPDPFAADERFVGVIWHRGLLAAAGAWRDRGLAIPVSQSRDGDLVNGVLHHLGFAESPRGSSSRNASGLLRGLIRCIEQGVSVGMLPDGPRGPVGEAKPGVVAVARATGTPLVPVGIASAPNLAFGSWDRTTLPLPFARVLCLYGEPIPVPRDATPEQQEECRLLLTKELNRLDAEAAARLR